MGKALASYRQAASELADDDEVDFADIGEDMVSLVEFAESLEQKLWHACYDKFNGHWFCRHCNQLFGKHKPDCPIKEYALTEKIEK